ncbi:hypothetical protein GBSOP10_10498 [Armatimonadetes bacterium GBS]|nr:hypothetical protein HRbin14_00564 [bacterium HR14]GIV12806.1 MAG: hypothetical protein KatS3mg021_1088 [Fimbriimonadales bacterium]CUU07158.1 hypothetical protein GBSOP10_10498 [Armatimonadetes bacterium GBS]CUU37859.1 hypothetical protein GXSOP10_13513 [Armatimonadetes bacterium GXS]
MKSIKVRGTLVSPQVVRLQEPLPLPEGAEVEVWVETPQARGSLQLMLATLEKIHAQLEASGHIPPTAEEVLARIENERASWEESNGAEAPLSGQ